MGKTPTTLIIMDGFGLTQPGPGNAVSLANTPVLDRLWADYAHTTLSASGLDVGLPEGQMGNSEVGHTNIGGGTITANYDGVHKHHTTIGSNVHVGAGNLFVAPVTVGDGVTTGAGSVVRHDVPSDSMVYSENTQHVVEGWKPEWER